MSSAPMLVFDGDCAFCNRAAQFVLAHEHRTDLLFVPRKSPFGLQLREQFRLQRVESMLWIEHGRAYTEFEAVAHLAGYVGGIYARFARVARLLPRVLMNFAYRCIATVRKRILRPPKQCMLLTAEQQRRFVEIDPANALVPGLPSTVLNSSHTVQS